MTIFIAPDKFKGSLSTFEVCTAIEAGLKKANTTLQTHCFPMADGGDGFAAVLKHYWNTETIRCATSDPLGRHIKATYEWQADKNTAIIEVAAASGIALLPNTALDVLRASTYGTGVLIADAIGRGATDILLGLGGSATNDAGIGILNALGWTFLNEEGNSLLANGASLAHIHAVYPPLSIPKVRFTLACDVNNLLYGPTGAAQVYARQKGADNACIAVLDEGLQHYAAFIRKTNAIDVQVPGAGAAGGIAASLLPWFPTHMISGADLILQESGIVSQLREANWLITGEGKFDDQSMQGKLLSRLLAAAANHEVPVAIMCGKMELTADAQHSSRLEKIMPVCQSDMTVAYCMTHAAELLQQEALLFGKSLTV